MNFQRVNRTNAEKAFGSVENRNGATILGNYPVCLATGAGSADGLQVVSPAAGNLQTFFGIADSDITDADQGIAQTYGYRDSIRIFAHGTSVTTATGVVIGPGTSAGVSSTGLVDKFGPVISMEAIGALINSPGGYAKGVIKAL